MEKKVFLKLNGSSSQALPPSFFEVAVVCYVVDEQKAKSLAFIYLEKKTPPGPSYSLGPFNSYYCPHLTNYHPTMS